MDRDKEIRELINNDLSEKSSLLMKYKYKVYKITDNISHWFPYIRYSEPNLKFKYINAPLCNWTVNIDLSDNDNIVLLNNAVYGKELSIDEQYYCNCLFNYIKCNKIVVDYDIEEAFDFSNEDESSYIYSIIKKMLAVFNENNIKEYAKMLCSRCLFGYQKKQYYFLYRDIKYENSLYLLFKYNPDVSLSYLMIYFIEKLGYFETLVALYYFKCYCSYDTIVSDSDVIDYIHNREEKEDILYEIKKFKIYLNDLYMDYIDICIDNDNKKLDIMGEIFRKHKFGEIANKYFKHLDDFKKFKMS